MASPAGPAATPLQAAVDRLHGAVEHLTTIVDGGALFDLGAHGVVDLLQQLQLVRNRLPVIEQTVIQHGAEQGIPAVLAEKSMTRVLTHALRISHGEATRRVNAAEHLADRHSPLGEPLTPIRAHLARAQRDGQITPEHVTLIDTALRKVDRCDPAAVDAGEALLLDHAHHLGIKDLDLVAARLIDAIDPDGVLPADEAEHRHRRYLHLTHRRDGAWAGEFRLTPDTGQKLAALLQPLMCPQTTVIPTDPDTQPGTPRGKHVTPDERTPGQRRHDALDAVLDAVLRSGDRPATANGTPATVIITIPADQLTHPHGVGAYADGTPVSARATRRLADQAAVVVAVTNTAGAVLDLHRTRRIATPAQTLALIARDRGCSFPSCDAAPNWCERHHIIPWTDGGPTNLDNLTLVCGYHHRHFAERGWRCHITDDGLPAWTPPTWIDRDQHPIINARITLTTWTPQDSLDLSQAVGADPPDPLDTAA